MTQPDRQRWRVVAGLFGVLMVSSGFGFYNLSVYVNVFAETHSVSASLASGLATAFFVAGGIAGIGVARLLERFQLTTIMIGGAAICAAALTLSGYATSIWQLFALFVLFGIGNTGVSIIVSTQLVTDWFPGPNRALALSITSTGLSVGGIVITPISAWALENLGVGTAMPWIGAAFLLLTTPFVLAWIRPAPKDTAGGTSSVDGAGHHARAILRSRFFVMHTFAYVLLMGVQVGGIAHLYSRAEELGGFGTAALSVQLLSGASILSRILGGWLLLRVSAYGFTVANLIVQTIGVSIIATAAGPTVVAVGAVVFGASVGNLLMLQPLQLAETYGANVLARIFAVANAVTLIGVAAGPLLLGVLRDQASYGLAYGVGAGVSLAALAALALARTNGRPQAQ